MSNMKTLRNILPLIQKRKFTNKTFNRSKILYNLLLQHESRCTIHQNKSRHFCTQSTPRKRKEDEEEPFLLQLPNPFLWLKMKWRFRKLNYFWDPDFNEADFIRGSTQAVVTITHLIGDNNFKDLQGLLTKQALLKLRREVILTWPELLKQNISLKQEHIKAVTPVNVRMMENARIEMRFCDIDLMFVALKRIMYKRKQNNRILVFNILSRFRRNYSDGAIPDWTVAIFTMDVAAYKPSID